MRLQDVAQAVSCSEICDGDDDDDDDMMAPLGEEEAHKRDGTLGMDLVIVHE